MSYVKSQRDPPCSTVDISEQKQKLLEGRLCLNPSPERARVRLMRREVTRVQNWTLIFLGQMTHASMRLDERNTIALKLLI